MERAVSCAARTLLLAVMAVVPGIFAGCNSSSSSFGVTNTTGPALTEVQYVDIDGNGVDEDDIVVMVFDQNVFIASETASAFAFTNPAESFGSGATQTQNVSGTCRVEIMLGSSPVFTPGVSALDVKPSGSINIVDDSDDDARPQAFVTVTEMTTDPPVLVQVMYNDADLDGTINAGDTLLAEFDKPITIPGGETVAGNFTLPVTGDGFGTSPTLTAFSSDATNRGALITLDAGATFTVSGVFDNALLTAGSPSGLEVAGSAGITDTLTSGANTVTTGTQVDVTDQGASRFYLLQDGDLFPGNTDGTAPDVSASGFFAPRGSFHFDGSVTVNANTFSVDLFFVADTSNNRVLIYEGLPTGNGAAANAVLGQLDLNSNLPNQSDEDTPAPTAGTLWRPRDVHFDSATNKLFVSDSSNNRVLIYHDVIDDTGMLALVDGAAADVVLGQTIFTSRQANQGGSPTSRTLAQPGGLHVSGGQLIVADAGNHRVLVWTAIPTASNAQANTVLGQADFMSNSANGGGSVASTVMSSPTDAFIDTALSIDGSSGAILVADQGNNRSLIFETVSPSTGAAADKVLGQATFITATAATTAAGQSGPTGVTATSTSVYVADRANHRVMIYSVAAITTSGVAGTALGQVDNVSAVENRDGSPSADSLSFPWGVSVSDATTPSFFVADTENHRVLDWTTPPTADGSADLVHGQGAFTTSDAKGHLANQFTDISVAAGQLAVADRLNNRVLIYDSLPTAGNPTPDVVVGQGSLFDTLANQGGSAGLATLSLPEGVFTDGTRLVVADTGNNRVLVFNTIPASDGASADFVLGQSSSSGTSANAGGLTAATMDSPTRVFVAGTRLLVSDRDNHRVLIFDDITALSTGASADFVVGQDDFTTNLVNQGSALPRATSLKSPQGLAVMGTRLYVADSGNHRVLGFDNLPLGNGLAADFVLGQSDFEVGTPGTSTKKMREPHAVATDGNRLFVADTGNHRVMVYNVAVATTNPSAAAVLGQGSFNLENPNRGAATPSAETLSSPTAALFNGVDLWIADQGNSRLVRVR